MEFYEKGNFNSKERDNLRCFETNLGGNRIMNISEIGNTQKYSYYKFILNGKQLKLSYISDEFIKERFANSSQFINTINKNIGNEKLFEGNIVLKKADS